MRNSYRVSLLIVHRKVVFETGSFLFSYYFNPLLAKAHVQITSSFFLKIRNLVNNPLKIYCSFTDLMVLT